MRRKGTPCACDCDPCKGKNSVRAINNVSPDPNGDFEIKAGNGIGISQSGNNSITIINQAMASSFVAGNNIDITPVGDDLQISVTDDVSINNLNVAGDIIQQGAAYETHAEKIYTTNDYIYMRNGAVGGLAVGAFSGFQVEKYDGTNDGRLVIDNTGTARVGDVGDEQPLLTRDENADLTDGECLIWDSANSKAVTQAIPSDIATALASKNPLIGIQTQSGSSSLIAGEQGIGNLTIAKTGMYLIHIVGETNFSTGTAWSIVGITKGGNLLTRLQNLYYQSGGTYYHSVIGIERFTAGQILGIYRQCSTAMNENWTLSATFLGDY